MAEGDRAAVHVDDLGRYPEVVCRGGVDRCERLAYLEKVDVFDPSPALVTASRMAWEGWVKSEASGQPPVRSR